MTSILVLSDQYMLGTNTLNEIIQTAIIDQIYSSLLSSDELVNQLSDIKV